MRREASLQQHKAWSILAALALPLLSRCTVILQLSLITLSWHRTNACHVLYTDIHIFSGAITYTPVENNTTSLQILRMRLNSTSSVARVGNVDIHDLARVTELDSGLVTESHTYDILDDGSLNVSISHLSLQSIERQLAIIVPCMNEEHFIVKGVLHGIPHDCLTILVSNSSPPNFESECKMLAKFCTDTKRQGIAIHQQDIGVAAAFSTAGMPHIVDHRDLPYERPSAGRVRNGKGEAMMIGITLAKLAGKRYVGFIDADNFVPGAVQEYCKVFAAGLYHALHFPEAGSSQTGEEPLAMVRIKWKSKPKIADGKLVPQESGRCSRVVNDWMNGLLCTLTGNIAHENFIKTANAGEHAMSIDLALRLDFATGYAVEPFQLINAWDSSGIFPPTPPSTSPKLGASSTRLPSPILLSRETKVLQIETLNPHIHDFGKGEEHILRMQAQGLSTIYHSRLAPNHLKHELREYMREKLANVVGETGVPERACLYPPMKGLQFPLLKEVLKNEAVTLTMMGKPLI